MARYCCACNKKIGGWDSYYPLDNKNILCAECGHMTTSEVSWSYVKIEYKLK